MKKYFCNYEQSLALKELGFNKEPISTFGENKNYDNLVLLPLKVQSIC